MRLKKQNISDDGAALKPMGWLTTFNDMITLLMVFFVLIFSMGSLDADRFKHFQSGLQSAMGVLYEGSHAPDGLISDEQGYVQRNEQAPAPSGQTAGDFEALTRQEGLEAEYTRRGIQLTLDDDLLFSSASAQLTDEGRALLDRVAKIIVHLNRSIRVEGHTDDRPIATRRYPSNWELSTARAISVVKYFIAGGIPPILISAAGYGDAKPRVANDTDANRSKNRRVEIILGQIEPTEPSFEGE